MTIVNTLSCPDINSASNTSNHHSGKLSADYLLYHHKLSLLKKESSHLDHHHHQQVSYRKPSSYNHSAISSSVDSAYDATYTPVYSSSSHPSYSAHSSQMFQNLMSGHYAANNHPHVHHQADLAAAYHHPLSSMYRAHYSSSPEQNSDISLDQNHHPPNQHTPPSSTPNGLWSNGNNADGQNNNNQNGDNSANEPSSMQMCNGNGNNQLNSLGPQSQFSSGSAQHQQYSHNSPFSSRFQFQVSSR